MKHLRFWLPLVVPFFFVGAVAFAKAYMRPHTWTVNAAGGADFIDIQTAITKAEDGDTILVLAGSYLGFTLDKSLALIGGPNVSTGGAVVEFAPGPVVMADMDVKNLEVFDCTEAVTLDRLTINSWVLTPGGRFGVNVERCADVRFVDVDITIAGPGDGTSALRVDSSRVELTSSQLQGVAGVDGECDPFYLGYAVGYGGDGVESTGDSFIHATLSDVRGGRGGDLTYVSPWCYVGYAAGGGDGIGMGEGELVSVGSLFAGGDGGDSLPGHYCGNGGTAVEGNITTGGTSIMRHSGGSTFLAGSGGSGGSSCGNGQTLAINKAAPSPRDPSLERLSVPVVGSTVTLRVKGHPGAYTRLFLSTQPALLPNTNTFLELLLVKEQTIGLGFLSSAGSVDHVLDLNPYVSGWPRGTTVYAQTSSIYPGGEHRLSNSLPLVLR